MNFESSPEINLFVLSLFTNLTNFSDEFISSSIDSN